MAGGKSAAGTTGQHFVNQPYQVFRRKKRLKHNCRIPLVIWIDLFAYFLYTFYIQITTNLNMDVYFMKYVLLSADGEISVFSVPDKVANNLQKYCLKFAVIGYIKALKQQSFVSKWAIQSVYAMTKKIL